WPRSWLCAITPTYRRSMPACWPPARARWLLSAPPCASSLTYASACLKTAPLIAAITRYPLDCQDGICGVRHLTIARYPPDCQDGIYGVSHVTLCGDVMRRRDAAALCGARC